MNIRKSGILLHPTSLPGSHGIGDLGNKAYRFIDSLLEMKQSIWQILPLGPTDIYNSPYSPISTFAGNHLLISLDLLVEDGLIDAKIIKNKSINSNKINFKEVIEFKMFILEQVAANFNFKATNQMKNSFKNFCIENSYWLDDYAEYWGLRKVNKMKAWINWDITSLHDLSILNEAKIIQYIFHKQWYNLRNYCKQKHIQIIGDMPIYVGYESSDVYSNRQLFQLNQDGHMIFQSGCPPCKFQKNGQLWGNPIYAWEKHKKTNFKWWTQRFKKLFEMVDIIRLDHFIGYDRYYRIPVKDKTAINGEWVEAIGKELFRSLMENDFDFNVIVEDLGEITDSVINLKNVNNFPGIRVLQFDLEQIPKLKEFSYNSIVYTGTHDNNTLIGWFQSLPKHSNKMNELSQKKLLEYFDCDNNEFTWEIINFILATNSKVTIFPLQDILEKKSSCRFNTPGSISSNNWSWMMDEKEVTPVIKNKLARLTFNNNRVFKN